MVLGCLLNGLGHGGEGFPDDWAGAEGAVCVFAGESYERVRPSATACFGVRQAEDVGYCVARGGVTEAEGAVRCASGELFAG